MKKSTFYAVILAVTGISLMMFKPALKAQECSIPKVYAVINKAAWCPVCKANGSKLMTEVVPALKEIPVKFINNDLTNKTTIAASAKELNTLQILNPVKEINYTGVIILIDAKTKKVIKTVDISQPAEKIIEAIKSSQG